MTVGRPRLRCRRIRKAFPGVLALDDVTLDVAPGTIHAIAGENGAGKSTLMKVLAGAVRSDGGHIEIDGRSVAIADTRSARREGIAIVYQEFNLAPDLSVSENIFLGRWPRRRFSRLIDFSGLHARASRLLHTLGIEIPVRHAVGRLTVAQQQMVEIAKALSLDARILILDEPSAVLTPHELATLFRLIRGLRARGVSVIYISHRLDEIFDIADAVTVLRDGKHISTRLIGELDRNCLVTEMVGRDLKDEFPSRSCKIGEVVLRVCRLCARHRFSDVSLEVRAGEVFGLTGLVGSGRSSVGKTAFGALRASSGTVAVGDRVGPFGGPRAAIAAGLALLPEDRKREGLLLERTVRENLTLARRGAAAVAGFLQIGREQRLAGELMANLQVRAVSTESPVLTLSGGNQQKVLLARWISLPHKAIILDEPTRGVDVGAKYEIHTLVNRLAGEGTAIVMISSDLPEVIGMSDRIGVMYEGSLTGVLDNGKRDVTQERIMRLAAGEEVVR